MPGYEGYDRRLDRRITKALINDLFKKQNNIKEHH